MPTKLGLRVVVIGLAALGLAAPAVAATPAAAGSLAIERDEDAILWAEVSVESPGAVVAVDIRAPAKHRGSVLWQRCLFDHASEGVYRCGIDVADGSLARERSGWWIASATVDGATVGRIRFTTTG